MKELRKAIGDLKGRLSYAGKVDAPDKRAEKIRAIKIEYINNLFGTQIEQDIPKIVQAAKPLVAKNYESVEILLQRRGEYLPPWMEKGRDESIRVYPGNTWSCGYAITKGGDILSVKSVFGIGPDHAARLEGSAYLNALLNIRSQWINNNHETTDKG